MVFKNKAAVFNEHPNRDEEVYQRLLDRIKTDRDRLQDILHAIEHVQPVHFNDEDLRFFTEPFPIVWASYTETPTFIYSGVKGGEEGLLQGPQELGKNIQVIFTDHAHVEQVRTYIEKRLEHTAEKVRVLSFDTAHFLFSQQLLEDSA